MAEFILFWKDHWMDSLDTEKVASLPAKQKQKYDARYQRGDIVEVWADGGGEWRVKGNSDFSVVKVPGLSVAKTWMAPQEYQSGVNEDGAPVMTMLKRRAWYISEIDLPKVARDSMNTGRVATINERALRKTLKAKP
jgi:hypothetical protein